MVLLCLTGRYYEYSGILLDSIVVLWGSIWFIGDLSGTFIAWSTKGFIICQRDVTSKHDGYKLKTACGIWERILNDSA